MSCHVLIIEDNADVRESFASLLRIEGYHATTAATGEDALAAMQRHENVELILLDLMMPDLDGWEIRARQVDAGLLPGIPVVIVSGISQDLSTEVEAIDAADALPKPVLPEDLLSKVEEYCGAA